MADEFGADSESDPTLANGADNAPQAGVLSQYIKDLSFENPNAPAVYQWQGQPQIDVQVNIGVSQLGDEIHEVALRIEVAARAEEGAAFQVDLLYAGLFAIRNVPDEQMQPFLLAEAPRLLFPFARQIISDAVMQGGFPPLFLDPIDFGALYMQRAAQAQAELGEGQAPDVVGQA